MTQPITPQHHSSLVGGSTTPRDETCPAATLVGVLRAARDAGLPVVDDATLEVAKDQMLTHMNERVSLRESTHVQERKK